MKLKSNTSIVTEIYNEDSGELVSRIHWSTDSTLEGFPQDNIIEMFGKDVLEKVNPIVQMITDKGKEEAK